MKIKEVHYFCDVCDQEYANSEIKYKVKSKYGFRGRWHKFAVCEDCYERFVRMGEKAKNGKCRMFEKVNGKWIFDGYTTKCSNCGKYEWKGYIPTPEEALKWMPYCPKCGAEMEAEE